MGNFTDTEDGHVRTGGIDMEQSIEDLEREADAKEAEAKELRRAVEELREAKAEERQGKLKVAAKSILKICADAEEFIIHEGKISSVDELPFYRDEITVALDSVRERKGCIDASDAFDTWNQSYRDNECVEMTVYIPRDALESNGVLPSFREE